VSPVPGHPAPSRPRPEATDEIPLARPLLGEAEERRVLEVLRSGRLSLGPRLAEFESAMARRLGVPHACAVSSGTAGLHLAVRAAGIRDGDEVITSPLSFVASANVVVYERATPVFVDVDPVTLNLDPAAAEAAVGQRTSALLPVHLFGRPAPLADLATLGVPIIEDAAQAFGSPDVARTGIATTFSFYPTKNLFGLGDGGLVATKDEELAERIRMLRFHGSRDKVDFQLVGYNSRLDELQAAALRIFLRRLDEWTRLRREAAARYAELGLGAVCELPPDEPGHVYHLFVCRARDRDRITNALRQAEIGTGAYYVTPLHLQPALRYLGYGRGSLPETERAARENFAVPLWAGIDAATQERVVEIVSKSAPVAA
jgi:dTDP-4-amino-4,6-dideoxygalactose transaminase